MNMRPLALDKEFEAQCKKLQKFAEDKANWYVLGEDMEPPFIPGDKPEYVIETEFSYRVVLTITHVPSKKPEPFRHLTISVPGGAYPHPFAVFTVAHLLGFTGTKMIDGAVTNPGPWAMTHDPDEGCIIVQQDFV